MNLGYHVLNSKIISRGVFVRSTQLDGFWFKFTRPRMLSVASGNYFLHSLEKSYIFRFLRWLRAIYAVFRQKYLLLKIIQYM
jgi:hypothetical protein